MSIKYAFIDNLIIFYDINMMTKINVTMIMIAVVKLTRYSCFQIS